MASKKEKIQYDFFYSPVRDFVLMVITILIEIIGYLVLDTFCVAGQDATIIEEIAVIVIKYFYYIVIFGVVNIIWLFTIINRFNDCVTVENDIKQQVIYDKGIIFRKTIIIPACKMKKCTIISGPIQRLCGVGDICITSIDDVLIHNIVDADEAYELIVDMSDVV